MAKLTDVQVRNAKPGPKDIKLADGNGLTLLLKPNGAKLWRLRYRRDGRETQSSLGTYPAVSLRAARERAQGMRDQRAEARNARQRQWDGTDKYGGALLVPGDRHRLALHRAR